eukprot:8659111-Pyramimonas_sp.AAC.1
MLARDLRSGAEWMDLSDFSMGLFDSSLTPVRLQFDSRPPQTSVFMIWFHCCALLVLPLPPSSPPAPPPEMKHDSQIAVSVSGGVLAAISSRCRLLPSLLFRVLLLRLVRGA